MSDLNSTTFEAWYDEFRREMNYPADLCLHDLFLAQVQKTPQKVALIDGNVEFTYTEVYTQVMLLSGKLRESGVRVGDIVGIFMERCHEFVVSYLAILVAGAAYMPLEVAYPPKLLADVVNDSKPKVILTKKNWEGFIECEHTCALLCLDGNWQEIGSSFYAELEAAVVATGMVGKDDGKDKPGPKTLAYTVYSSGTTGKPKGICCPHQGAVHSYTWRHKHYPCIEGDRVGCNVFFVWEVVRALMCGSTSVVIPDDVIYDPHRLSRFIETFKVTRMLFTPSLMQLVLDTFSTDALAHMKGLNTIWLCGEVVTTDLRNRIVTAFPAAKLLNLFSISECHDVSVSDLSLDVKVDTTREFQSCGIAMANVGVHILDENLVPVAQGEIGGTHVSGPTLALGYLNRPITTKQRFFYWKYDAATHTAERLDDVGQLTPPEGFVRVYWTGDQGRMNASGEIFIEGRADSMVKIRGYSVVLGKVQVCVVKHPSIKSAVVVAEGKEGSDKKLVAYIVFADGVVDLTVSDMLKHLRDELPHYAIPSIYVVLPVLPTSNTTGKLNNKLLPLSTSVPKSQLLGDGELSSVNSTSSSSSSNSGGNARVTATEARLMGIWCDLLDLNSISTADNFMACGGHSLLAARLVSQISEKFTEVRLPASTLFQKQYQTLSALAALVDQMMETGLTYQEITLQAEETKCCQSKKNTDATCTSTSTSTTTTTIVTDTAVTVAPVVTTQSAAFFQDEVVAGVTALKASLAAVGQPLLDQKDQQGAVQNEQVLLTGAAGYLGMHLLAELLITLRDCTVVCLLRGSGGLDRLQQVARSYALTVDWERVTVQPGDLTLPRCGLPIGFTCDLIVHAGAYVNLAMSYDQLKPSNVQGTAELVLIAAENDAAFAYVSTLGVFRTFSTGGQATDDENSATGPCTELADAYCQTKWVAEQMVLQTYSTKAVILRCGTLVGSADTGVWNDRDFLYNFFASCLALDAYPTIPDWQIEMTPVGFAAKAIVRSCTLLLDAPVTTVRVQHIVNPEFSDYTALVDLLSPKETAPFVSFQDWVALALKASVDDAFSTVRGPLNNTLALVSSVQTAAEFLSDFGQLTNTCSKTLAHLNAQTSKRQWIQVPKFTKKLFALYFEQSFTYYLPAHPHPRAPLWGKVAFVTGASSGIGEAIARGLVAAGARVFIVARREARLQQIVHELNSVYRRTAAVASYATCDVVNRRSVKKAHASCESQFGPVDLLINCAGIMPFTNIESLQEDEWDKMVDVNCKGVMNSVGAALEGMVARKRGHIVNISSDAGRKVFSSGLTVYSATKFFVEAFSRGLRTELAGLEANVRVTCVQPGDVRTDLALTSTDKKAHEQHGGYLKDPAYQAGILLPEQIAQVVVFAVSRADNVALNELLVEPTIAPI